MQYRKAFRLFVRASANDVLFDVMMYLTPEYAQETLDFLVMEGNALLKVIHWDQLLIGTFKWRIKGCIPR